MSNEPSNEKQQISQDFRFHVNRSGHGFHYAVVRRLGELSLQLRQQRSDWLWDRPISEFPVVIGTDIMHVDFIVSGRSRWTRPTPIYLVAECKRPDPKFSQWCFVRAPFAEEEIVFDRLIFRPPSDLRSEPVMSRPQQKNGLYHIGYVTKGKASGESGPSGGGAINDATAQVLRGVSGLINHLFAPAGDGGDGNRHFAFLPVIFTTAEIWVTELDISSADLNTGNVPDFEPEKKDWIWFNHNRSSRLRHGLKSSGTKTDNLADALKAEFTRSVAIVGVEGIDSFLSQNFEWLFG